MKLSDLADETIIIRENGTGTSAAIERVYASLDVFVLSSKSEGLSNTILEAMASTVAVVATRVGGADELVEDGATGLLVPPQDSAALADAVGWLIRDAEMRQSMCVAARRRALSRFALDRMLRDYVNLYGGLRATGVQLPRPIQARQGGAAR